MEHRCVECGFPIETLFLQYSPGNVRLLRCANCEAVADEYIEWFVMEVNLCVSSFGCLYPFLVLVIFFEYLNTPLNLWYEMVLYALMIKDRSLLLKKNEGEWGSSMSFSSIVSTFQEVSNDVLSSADTCGCLCWKLYVYLCFSSFNEAVAK
ncbi:hypothetical protein POTOM_008566 [Populus tomentosa]|uniref:Protein ARV n=1 Tax=Populus tomentosa TaxID=118781 RepID=A0A8X8AH94_POPTO|nr:hypothetical protein POTOM_008566 [Populus tomentosa]